MITQDLIYAFKMIVVQQQTAMLVLSIYGIGRHNKISYYKAILNKRQQVEVGIALLKTLHS